EYGPTSRDRSAFTSLSSTLPSGTRKRPLTMSFAVIWRGADGSRSPLYSQSGATGRVMYRGKYVAPIFSFATQTRPEGSQVTFSVDSYVLVNRCFYATIGYGQSPDGTAVLWPSRRYGGTAFVTVPNVTGLVATVGALRIESEAGHYDRTLNVGAMY